MYLEKQSRERLLEALDRLIECTRTSFREEEALMALFSSTPDPMHRDQHNEVLSQMNLLRRDVLDFDRGRLLAQLIVVDRQLTSHLLDELVVPDKQKRQVESERNAPSMATADHAQ